MYFLDSEVDFSELGDSIKSIPDKQKERSEVYKAKDQSMEVSRFEQTVGCSAQIDKPNNLKVFMMLEMWDM